MSDYPNNQTTSTVSNPYPSTPVQAMPPLDTTTFSNGYARMPQSQPPNPGNSWKSYLLGAIMAVLVSVLVFQQLQINRLSEELGMVSDDVRRSDVRSRLSAVEEKLQQTDNRLTYLDTKITAVDQKAQASLNKWREQENRPNFVMDLWNRVSEGLGFGR
jgi:hypothetical protein